METDYFQPVLGAAINPSVRCLVGLYGSQRDDGLDDAFSAILEDDTADEPDLLSYVLNVDDADRVRFLIGSQSLRPNGSQITLVTLFEPDDSRPVHLVKQTFSHPDGEVVGLTAIAAQPNWFVSTYSTYSTERPELRTGARIWRLPGLTDDGNPSDHETFVELTESPSNGLEYVTTLPLDKYSGIRKIVAHPSGKCADLACIVGPPTDSIDIKSGPSGALNAATSYLVLLQAPSAAGSGEYRELSSTRLCLPSPSHFFTSYLKTKITHMRTSSATDRVAITSSPNAMRWSSYQQASQLAVAFESGVLGWDVRSPKPTYWLEAAHWPCVRDLDFNPHRPEILATGGDDGCIRLWDLRYLKRRLHPNSSSPASEIANGEPIWGTNPLAATSEPDSGVEPVYCVQAHSHWVWSIRYHPTRDQLLLSAGSDCRVCLYSLPGFSSDAVLDRESSAPDEEEAHHDTYSTHSSRKSVHPTPRVDKHRNGLLARLEHHEESVYAADWSPVDPWYFASVSYDGNFLLNQVSESVKLDILLQSNED